MLVKIKKIARIQSHHFHLQWEFKLLAGKFTWDNKAKHCWVVSTNFWKQCPAIINEETFMYSHSNYSQILACKKKKKKISPTKKYIFYFFSLQLFSADGCNIFKKKFPWKHKKTPTKVAHNQPQTFFSCTGRLPKPAQN